MKDNDVTKILKGTNEIKYDEILRKLILKEKVLLYLSPESISKKYY